MERIFFDLDEAIKAVQAAETLELYYTLEKRAEEYESFMSKTTQYQDVYIVRISE
jgi:hypothetical protein